MSTSVLLIPAGKVTDDAVHILRRRHEKVHGLQSWLRVAVASDRLDLYKEAVQGCPTVN